MPPFFLDVVDVVPARSAAGPGLDFYLLLAATILSEAGILYVLRYNLFGKSLLHALTVNLASLAAGFLLIEWLPGLFVPVSLLNLFFLFVITVVIETPLLYWLNRHHPLQRTIRISLLMNLLTYLLFYGYIQFIAR